MLTLTITNPNTADPNLGTDSSYTGTNPVTGDQILTNSCLLSLSVTVTDPSPDPSNPRPSPILYREGGEGGGYYCRFYAALLLLARRTAVTTLGRLSFAETKVSNFSLRPKSET